VECRTDGAKLPAGNRSGYVGTARIEDIDSAKAIMLIGTNPRSEAPVLNARIRRAWLNGAKVGVVGDPADLTYEYFHLGTGRETLAKMAESHDGDALGKDTLVIVGQGALRGGDGAAVLGHAMRFAEITESKFLVLHGAAGRVGAMDLGCVTEGGIDAALGAEVILNLGADEIEIPAGPFVIYQGSHGDRGAHRADVILPGAAWVEESGIFVNTEGRPQLAARAGFPPGEARENWAILRALSGELGEPLPFDTLAALRAAMIAEVPHLGRIDAVPVNDWQPMPRAEMSGAAFAPAATDHYLANPIMRASEVMAELSRLAQLRARPLAAE
jgi:NADH-quinone oxidoreductase subunit G